MAYYYTRDHLGSVRELLNSSGTILTRYTYDPYGRTTVNHPVTSPSTTDATFQFTDDYYHTASGLCLTIFRAYDSNSGRWLSRDPIKERGGVNLYDYCRDDPTNVYDPLGLSGTSMTITIPQNYPDVNRRVHITAKSDCCKNIKFIQYTSTRNWWNTLGPVTLDNVYSSDSYYANQWQTGDGSAEMEDAPGPGGEGSPYVVNALARLGVFFATGLVQEFVTCAICQDPGPNHNKILQCIHWKVVSNGVGQDDSAGPYTGH